MYTCAIELKPREMASNIDHAVVDGFGDEWSRFDQHALPLAEWKALAEMYFDLLPWSTLPPHAIGFDLGCGSGRWAKYVASRVGTLHCIDASAAALGVARDGLAQQPNVQFHHASVDEIPLPDESQDFGYSLGVLHHVPDTGEGIRQAVAKLKPGAPFLVYLYYAFDNRPAWFRMIWRASDVLRRIISRLPHSARFGASQVIAALVYFPLARAARLLELSGIDVELFPLAPYRHRSFYVMRTDALDRFGTRLEQRFTKEQIREMMTRAGLERIAFSDRVLWGAIGWKRSA
ncbi:MAG: Methyltransferase type 11 [Gemmatimonadetes bacterium]|nr:Methyltransferase type 11 [Gemmatimonadota bacterium]